LRFQHHGMPYEIVFISKKRHVIRLALLRAAERITFEVDGPHHFMANTLAVTGEMLARQKLLRARGWHVISVPFFHWAGRSDGARAQWLLQVCPHTMQRCFVDALQHCHREGLSLVCLQIYQNRPVRCTLSSIINLAWVFKAIWLLD